MGGSVFAFSQFKTVKQVTPSRSAACRCVRLSSRWRFGICSPSVLGSKSDSFGFSALSVMGRNGKKATRPCPCGFLGHYSGIGHCTPDQVSRYRNRISGPLLDRIDLHIEVPAVPEKDLGSRRSGESSAAIRERVTAARARQIARHEKPNAHLSVKEVGEHCSAEADADQLARKAISALDLSARAYQRILKVARTIADLAGASGIYATHAAEAV
jgi:Magnesium chelatase, subunit ChlI C-terminal/Magnesium chelatase, subunit ChlI